MLTFHPGHASRLARGSILLTLPLVVLLAACGGGGGGGGGGGDHQFHALVINAAEQDKAIAVVDSGGTPTEQTAPTCTAVVYDFPLTDPFQFTVDGETVFDSTELSAGIPGNLNSDVIMQVKISKDGSVTHDNLRVGTKLSPPARTAYCPTLPGS